MNVLCISSKPAYPKNDGGTFALAAFLDTLIEANYQVSYLTIATEKHPFKHNQFPEQLSQKLTIDSCFIDTKVRPLNAFLHLFKTGSYNVQRFYSSEMRDKIHEHLRNNQIDLIILDSLFSTPYLEDIRSVFKGKIFVRTHNVEGDLWANYAHNAQGIKASYLKKLARDIQTYEVKTLSKCDGILTITNSDLQRFTELGVKTALATIPVSIKAQQFEMNYAHNTVYHFGSMNWEPNRESVDYLLSIWDDILAIVHEAKCVIAGTDSNVHYHSDPDKNIEVIGFVENPIRFSQEMGILVAPISTGSGVRIKILEAMNAGIPTVTSTIGALGIDYATSNCLLIADQPDKVVLKTIELLKNEGLREEIGKNGRDYIAKNHNIAIISQKLIEFINATV